MKKYFDIKLHNLVAIIICVIISKTEFAQLNLNTNATATQLVQSIVGNGCIASNVKINCPKGAFSTFTNTTSNIGLANGILLTTGSASMALGPNNSDSKGFNNGASGDVDLQNLALATAGSSSVISTYDGCAIEFDMVSSCDSVVIEYVFGSEEYPEYVNRQFNDIFGFFISGPNPAGGNYLKKNFATLPNSNVPVSINTINAGVNSNLYVNNANGTSIQYDGFTKPIKSKIAITPCLQYHLKIVIADILDGIFDSGIFIRGKSIGCTNANIYNDIGTSTNGLSNCQAGTFTFCRSGGTAAPYVVNYQLSGTAINGVDYATLSNSVVIPAGQTCITTSIVPLTTPNSSVTTNIKIAYEYGFCKQWDTLRVDLVGLIPIDAGPNVTICSEDSITIGLQPSIGSTYSWLPSNGLSDPNISNPKLSLTAPNTNSIIVKYVLSCSTPQSGTCILKDSLYVTVNPLPKVKISFLPNYCTNSPITYNNNSVAATGNTITNWYWDFGNNYFDINQNPVINYVSSGTFSISLLVTDNNGCKKDSAVTINIWPLPIVSFSNAPTCLGDPVSFANTSIVTGSVASTVWNFGDGSPINTLSSPTHSFPLSPTSYSVQLTVTSSKNCINSAQQTIYFYPKPIASFFPQNPSICIYNSMHFLNQSQSDHDLWNFGDNITDIGRNPTHFYQLPGTYTVSLVTSTNFGCLDSIKKTITVYDKPHINFTAIDTAGCPSFCTTYTGNTLAGSVPVTSWTWLFTNSDTKSGISTHYCYETKGLYSPSLVGLSSNGCVDTVTKSQYIHVWPNPIAAFTKDNYEINTSNSTVLVTNTSSPDVVNWTWDYGDQTTANGMSPGVHQYTLENVDGERKITLYVTNNFGCKNETFGLIFIRAESSIFIPNAFTPNDDKRNEIFRPEVYGVYATADYKMFIYNRWGEKIFEARDQFTGWDGTRFGTECPLDVYTYALYFYDKAEGTLIEKRVGKVILLR